MAPPKVKNGAKVRCRMCCTERKAEAEGCVLEGQGKKVGGRV